MVDVVAADVELVDPDVAFVAAGFLVEHFLVSGVGEVDDELGVRAGSFGFCVAFVELDDWRVNRISLYDLVDVLLLVSRQDGLVIFVNNVLLGLVLSRLELFSEPAFGEEFDLGVASHIVNRSDQR